MVLAIGAIVLLEVWALVSQQVGTYRRDSWTLLFYALSFATAAGWLGRR